jgi:hypothetical protein
MRQYGHSGLVPESKNTVDSGTVLPGMTEKTKRLHVNTLSYDVIEKYRIKRKYCIDIPFAV